MKEIPVKTQEDAVLLDSLERICKSKGPENQTAYSNNESSPTSDEDLEALNQWRGRVPARPVKKIHTSNCNRS